MNWERIEENWHQAKTEIKERWDKLSDHQLQDRVPGTRKQLIANIQASYGVNEDEAERQVIEWEELNQNTNALEVKPPGARDQLIGNIQTTYDVSKDEAERQVKTWGTKNADEIADYQRPTGGPWAHWPHT
jgi:uncharacterized protein YjbJ (UPF0337 family)